MKSFSSHEVTTLADLRKGGSREIILKEAKCPEHEDVMKIFCFDCDGLIRSSGAQIRFCEKMCS